MLRELKICILFNIHFILIKCVVPTQNHDELTVRKLDQKLIERKRQDTRDMCRIFNSEAIQANLPNETLPFDKYRSRKAALKLIEKKEEFKRKRMRRVKRDVMSKVNPALNGDDEERIETIVDKIYDDLMEKGEKIPYRRRGNPKAIKASKNLKAQQSGRRFPFAPLIIDGPIPTKAPPKIMDEVSAKPVRFVHAIVPYFIDFKTYDEHLVDVIIKAFDYFEKATCIRLQRLRERPTDKKSLQDVLWLYITNPTGIRQCVHTNERAIIKGVQMIVFGYDCMNRGDLAHEIMHVLGFSHEHVRPDRDQYITILWDNIKPGYRKYFEIHNKPIVEGLPYDYASVLHYPPRAFSRNGQVTILTKPGIKIGQREGLSEMDIEKVGMLYSNECINRNRDYLVQTCPSVVKADTSLKPVSEEDIQEYFEDRLWPYGVVHYRLRDKMEFTADEKENILAVIRHIQKETCIEFLDLTSAKPTPDEDEDEEEEDNQFESDEVERLVVLTGSSENRTKAILPDSTSDEEEHKMLNYGKDTNTSTNHYMDNIREELMRKGEQEKGINKVKGTAKQIAKTNVKEKNTTISVKKNTTISVKKKASIGAKGKNANTVGKEKNASVIKLQSLLRRKRAVPPSPSRRHASDILVLSRSKAPGCHCPQPGKPDGAYVLKINTDCFNTVNDLLHLFVHVLGLDHQHNMHDRDSYLHIAWDKLSEEIKKEMKIKLPPAASLGFPYDYQSVMHYPWLHIKNGKTNIMYPIWNDGWAMGHWQGLSPTDVRKIEHLYSKPCMERQQQAETTPETETTPDDENEE